MSYLQNKVAEYMADIGTDVPVAVTILVIVVALIISTRDIRIGFLTALLLFSLEFIVFSAIGYDTVYALAGIFLSFALLTLSLLIRKSVAGGFLP